MTTKQCTKKRNARVELLLCQSKPIAFLPFSLTSPSSLLKLPIISYGTAVLFISRQKRSINSSLFSKVPRACRTSITGKNRHGTSYNHSTYYNRMVVLETHNTVPQLSLMVASDVSVDLPCVNLFS